MRPLIGLFLLLPACASAQVTLSTVQGGVATPVSSAVSFGSVAAGWDAVDIVFNIGYAGSVSPYYLTYFNLQQGTPFSVIAVTWPGLPVAIPTGGLNFTVRFQPSQVAESYSAVLTVGDAASPITVVLLGQATSGFAAQAANQPVAAGSPIVFGSVQAGGTKTILLTLANQTGESLTVGAIGFQGTAFSLAGASPAGAAIPSGASAEIQLVFSPVSAGIQQGTLTIGVAAFPLQGTGTAPPPPVYPAVSLQFTPTVIASAEQGSLAVNLSSASASSGAGTVTLAFQPAVTGVADDPAVTFADGTRSVAFTVAGGASQGQFTGGPDVAFGAGTTAGVLTFTVTLGNQSAQSTLTIPAATIGIDAAVAARDVSCAPSVVYCTTTNIQLQINGWDNTRSASQLVFTFYNSTGGVIAPGNITVAAGSAFQQYFAASDMAGVFGLSVFFPVTGSSDDVVAAVVQMANSVGVAQTAQIAF